MNRVVGLSEPQLQDLRMYDNVELERAHQTFRDSLTGFHERGSISYVEYLGALRGLKDVFLEAYGEQGSVIQPWIFDW